MAIRQILVDTATWTETSGVDDPSEHWQQHPDCFVRLDMDAGDEDADGALMRERFDLHPLAAHDALRTGRPPKSERFDDDLINGYLALAPHCLNQIFTVPTIITVIFVPLSFLAGIYGMNLENLPEPQSRFGYITLLGLMAMIVALQLWFFRTRKWL